MPNPLKFVPMIVAQNMGRQELKRQKEPEALTEDKDNVTQYDQVMTTKLVIAYAVGMEAIHRARREPAAKGKAIDLACGPGHFTLCLQRYLNYDHVTGIDLAPNMIATAQNNARKQGLDKAVQFQLSDITNLKQFTAHSISPALPMPPTTCPISRRLQKSWRRWTGSPSPMG